MPEDAPQDPSPLAGYEDLPPLPTEISEDGKSLVNPQTGVLSGAYERFPEPIDNGKRGGFDVHVYFYQSNPSQLKYAEQLHERIRREFPELRIYRVFPRPVGPHVTGMFEVNLFTPQQFGAFVPWLVVHRGPLSALLHPNTTGGDEVGDHGVKRATWLGEKFPLNWEAFEKKS